MSETGNGKSPTRPATNQRSRKPSVESSNRNNGNKRSELPNDVTLTDRHVTPDELFGPESRVKLSANEGILSDDDEQLASRRPETRAQDARSRRSLAGDGISPLTSLPRHEASRLDATSASSKHREASPQKSEGGKGRREGSVIGNMDSRNAAGANGYPLPVRNVNPPRHSSLSNRSSFYHSGLVDENLMISNAKLDSTLLMMFSQDPYHRGGGGRGGALTMTPSIVSGGLHSDEISMAPVMWRVHPMDPVQKETLEREMTFIVDRVNPLDIVDGLSRQGVLTSMDINQLNRIQGQGHKAVTRLMVKTLQRRGQKAYPAFLQALQSRGYPDVCERVQESERALRHGMRTERPLTDWDNYNRLSPLYNTSPSFGKKLSPMSTDYNQYPMYNTLPMNAFSPLYTLPLSDPAPFTYPVASSQLNGFTGRLSPLLQEPIKLNHIVAQEPIKLNHTVQEPIKMNSIERQLDVLKDELKDLHDDMHDLKSALRQGNRDTKLDDDKHRATNHTSHNQDAPAAPEHHHHKTTPRRGDSPRHEEGAGVASTTSPTPTVAEPGEPNEVTVMLSPEQVRAYKVIEAQQLNQHLRDLQDEVRALHDDVTALSTSRSIKDGRRTRTGWSLGSGDDRPTPLESGISKSYPEPQTPHTVIDRQGSFFTMAPSQKGPVLPRRNAHKDCDPLPTPRAIKRANFPGAGGKNQDHRPEKSKNEGRPARVSHESHDPLPKPPDTLELEKSPNEPSDKSEPQRASKKNTGKDHKLTNPLSLETSKKDTLLASDEIGGSGGTQVKPKTKTKLENSSEKEDVRNASENKKLLTDSQKFNSPIKSDKGGNDFSKVKHSDKQLSSISPLKTSGQRNSGSDSTELEGIKDKQNQSIKNSGGEVSNQKVQPNNNQNKEKKNLDNRENKKSKKSPLSSQDKENNPLASPKPANRTAPSRQPVLNSRETVEQAHRDDGRGSRSPERPNQVSLIKQKVKDENSGHYGQDASSHKNEQPTPPSAQREQADPGRRSSPSTDAYSQTEASGDHKSTQYASGLDQGSPPAQPEDRAHNVGQLTSDLQSKVRTLKEEIAALRAQKNVETSRSQPDTRRDQENQAHRLERQLGDLYGQLRTLRGDVSQLKSDKQKRVVIAEPDGSDRSTKTKPDAAHQVRPETRQTNLPVKEQQQPTDPRRRSSPVYLSPDNMDNLSTTPRRSSEGDKLTTSGTNSRITSPSTILALPTEGASKVRRITSPHTVLPDQSLPWPEATRISISS